MTEKRKKIVAASGIFLFLMLSVLIFWFAGKPLIRFVSEPGKFRLWVDQHGLWGHFAFLGMVILQIFVAIIPGEPLEIAAGYAFGFWEGTLLCLLGTTIGGTAVFWFVRRFGVRAVEIFISKEQISSLKFLQNTNRLYTFFVIAFLLPGTPKDALSYCAGLTSIRFSQWMLITSLCRLPSLVTSTLGGNALGTKNWKQAILVFAVTLCISLAGLTLYRHMQKHHQTKHGKK